MAKKLEDMTEKELLIEIAKEQRKEALSGRISAAAIVILVLVLAVVFVRIMPIASSTLEQVNASLTEVEKLAVGVGQSLTEIDELVKNFNGVLVDNTDSVNKALSQVGEIDIESLNKSIKELSTILEPLAKLFGR